MLLLPTGGGIQELGGGELEHTRREAVVMPASGCEINRLIKEEGGGGVYSTPWTWEHDFVDPAC
jgi:hypothetical protein